VDKLIVGCHTQYYTKGKGIMNTYEEKKQKRIERYKKLAEKNQMLSNDAAEESIKMMDVIPMGQPIMGARDANYRARAWDKMGKSVELQDKADYYKSKAEAADNDIISSDDPEVLNKLRAKLKQLEKKREAYKASNKQAEAEGKDILPSYVLQNLGQNIKSVKDRIALLEKQDKEAAEHCGENVVIYESDSYKLIKNYAENRIQFIFNEKPSEEVRTLLKHWGFRWSPSNAAWQRQLNNAGLYAAKCIVNVIK